MTTSGQPESGYYLAVPSVGDNVYHEFRNIIFIKAIKNG